MHLVVLTSALRNGLTGAAIGHALRHVITVHDLGDALLVVGRTRDRMLVEVGLRDADPLVAFHAMPVRPDLVPEGAT
jgi:hypothetical protein